MDALSLLRKHFAQDHDAFEIVLEHSRLVAGKAVSIARATSNPYLDLRLVEEAALLHDIGVCRTNVPRIGCRGEAPYICHGILGREILESEGLTAHALVCERHIGVGIGVKDIVQQQLPLPKREMVPISLLEKIICFADLFYSKKPGSISREKSVEEIAASLLRHGKHKVSIFEEWRRLFHQ